MSFRLACADFTFPLLPHEKALDLVAMLEFDGIDIGLFEQRSHLWPSREFENVVKSSARLAKQLTDRGLKPADIFLQTDPDFAKIAINHPQPNLRRKARDWFLKTLDYANGCGSPHITCLPGVLFSDEPRSDSWQRCCDELAWRVEQAQARKLIFGVEAHVGSIVPNPRDAQRLAESVPGLTLTLDYTHFRRKGMPDSKVEPLIPFASHFHVRGARKGRLQTSFDENAIDYQRILNVMRSTGYQGYLGIEYVWIDWEHCNEVDNVSETIRFRDFIRSAMKGDA